MWNKGRGKGFYAGDRTLLSVTSADTDSVDYENIAFETNNFLVPVCFCLVSQEQFRGYSEQLMQAWSKIQPHRGSGWVGMLFQGRFHGRMLQSNCAWGHISLRFSLLYMSSWKPYRPMYRGILLSLFIWIFRNISRSLAILSSIWKTFKNALLSGSRFIPRREQPITSICWIGRDFHMENVR